MILMWALGPYLYLVFFLICSNYTICSCGCALSQNESTQTYIFIFSYACKALKQCHSNLYNNKITSATLYMYI